jgi:hypothetical protein
LSRPAIFVKFANRFLVGKVFLAGPFYAGEGEKERFAELQLLRFIALMSIELSPDRKMLLREICRAANAEIY